MKRSRRLSLGAALLLYAGIAAPILSLPTAAPLSAAEFRSRATLGYDSFIDRFTILDVDTLESVEEFYLSLGGSLSFGPRRNVSIGNLLKLGSQMIDDNLDFEASTSPRKSRLNLRGNIRWKQFQPGSDYEFGNDYLQANTVLRFRRELGEGFRLNLRNRFEMIDYRERTIFDYDYRYADGGIELEGGSGFDRMILVGGAIGYRDAPDTAALSYGRTLAELEARLSSTRGVSFHLASIGDRKEYRERIRSSYWNVTSYVDLDVNAWSGLFWSLKGESELTLFDRPDTIFFDTHFLRGGMKIRYPFGAASGVFIEPRYARMLCGDFAEERYGEASAVFGLDFLRNGDFWVNAAFEPGYRNYTLDPNELYSDFSFNRVSVMASIPLPAGATFNLMVTHDPERHSRRDDDFAVTLVSAEVTKRF